jgi:hypothetical protein
VRRTVDTRNTEGLAIICKAARFDRTTFSAIALLIGETAKRSAQQTNEMLALYDKVTPESAQRVMRFWRVRKEAVDAPITLAQAG